MTHTVYKYTLEMRGEQIRNLPVGAKILSVQMQNGALCLWAHVDLSRRSKQAHRIAIVGTGNPAPDITKATHLGTVQMHNGAKVFHVFAVRE